MKQLRRFCLWVRLLCQLARLVRRCCLWGQGDTWLRAAKGPVPLKDLNAAVSAVPGGRSELARILWAARKL